MSKRDESKVATRKKAIEAARLLWDKPGNYDRFGIREIAAAMEMSTGAIFSNFESKAGLWNAAFPGKPVPVDGHLTRLAPAMFAMLRALAEIDGNLRVITVSHPELAERLYRLLGQAEMAVELEKAA